MKIKVDAISKRQKVNVRVIKSRTIGHRTTFGHSMFIHTKDFKKLQQLRVRV